MNKAGQSSDNKYVIGADFGTDSVRSVIIDAKTGAETAVSVMLYPRWREGRYCDPARNMYRQHPLDYIESFEFVVKDALAKAGAGVAENVCGISFDTTASTPVITDRSGTPLALTPRFAEDPDAMFMLWKDHTAIDEADEINALAHSWEVDYTTYSGGIYSCEWIWAKLLHVLRGNEKVRAAAWSWIEHCDWMAALLTGNTAPEKAVRGRCAAGHKAMWHESWGGYPSEEFLTALSPLLAGFRGRVGNETRTSDHSAGGLCPEWARRLGLPENIAVGVGAIDCHIGAVGAGIRPGVLVKVMGTSTCDIVVASPEEVGNNVVRGICGQVDGSVLPGLIGFEAGQAAFGDIYAWFRKLLAWPLENLAGGDTSAAQDRILGELTRQAEEAGDTESGVMALDWFNGRRTPDADPRAAGAIYGLTLASTAPQIFRALVEATAFGSRAIMERMAGEGVAVGEVTAIGGIARKSPFVMQTMADILGVPIRVAASDQACALGAAMYAAVAAGVYADIGGAQSAMGAGSDSEYTPDRSRRERYDGLYAEYLRLGYGGAL